MQHNKALALALTARLTRRYGTGCPSLPGMFGTLRGYR